MIDFFARLFGRKPQVARSEDELPKAQPRPAASVEEQRLLADAGAWLTRQTITHARAFSLGEERRYEFDQDTGALTLVFADDARLVLKGQILASFQPRNRSLRWAWANSHVDDSVNRAANAARAHADVASFGSFRTPMFQVTFEDACRIAGLAARLSGCAGVYRCITDDSLTVFVGYAGPNAALPGAPAPTAEEEVAALAHVDAWDTAMFPFDREYNTQRRGGGAPDYDALQAGQMSAYNLFWRRDDDYWEPGSFGWPSDHDPARRLMRFAVPRRAGGVYVITQTDRIGATAHVIEFPGGAPWITDLDIDWGNGVLLDRPA